MAVLCISIFNVLIYCIKQKQNIAQEMHREKLYNLHKPAF